MVVIDLCCQYFVESADQPLSKWSTRIRSQHLFDETHKFVGISDFALLAHPIRGKAPARRGSECNTSDTSSSVNSVPSMPVVPRTARNDIQCMEPFLKRKGNRYVSDRPRQRIDQRETLNQLTMVAVDRQVEIHVPTRQQKVPTVVTMSLTLSKSISV